MRTKINADSLKEANIPKKFWKLDKTTYFGSPIALKQAEKYVTKFDKAFADGVGLKFEGGARTCKTFLATYVLKCLLARGHNVAYYSMDELFELYTRSETAGSNFLHTFKEPHCVVLDNVGISLGKGYANAIIKVITHRADNGLPFIICSPLTNEQLGIQYNDKIEQHFEQDLINVQCTQVIERIKQLSEETKREIYYAGE